MSVIRFSGIIVCLDLSPVPRILAVFLVLISAQCFGIVASLINCRGQSNIPGYFLTLEPAKQELSRVRHVFLTVMALVPVSLPDGELTTD